MWDGRPVYWVELEKGGGLILRIGIARDTYRPVVFRALNPDGTPAGVQVAILGFDYVSDARAAFDNDASVLVAGRVLGTDCRPPRRASTRSSRTMVDETHPNGEIAAVRTRRTAPSS